MNRHTITIIYQIYKTSLEVLNHIICKLALTLVLPYKLLSEDFLKP